MNINTSIAVNMYECRLRWYVQYIYKFVQVKWQRQQQLVESGKATKKVNERLGFEGLIKVLDRLIKIYIYLISKYYKSQQHIKIS